MSGWAGPGFGSVLSVFDLPAGVVVGVVVSAAGGGEVRGVCVAAVGPGFDVVEVAQLGCMSASGEGAGSFAGGDVVGEVGGCPVGGAAVVEELAGVVGDESPPGAGLVRGEAAGEGGGGGAVPVEVRGLVVAAGQGAEWDGDVDGGAFSVLFGQGRVSECPGEHVDERVGAALIRAAVVGLGVAEGVQHRLDERGAVGGQQRPEFGDAVVLRGGHHPPLGDRVVVALFGAARRGSAAITARRSEVPNWARVCSGARRSTRCSIFVVVSASNGVTAAASFMACR